MLSINQGHLAQLEICPRKYQYVFFDTLLGPSTYEQHLTTQWGSQFHLLMQQQALDLPVGALSQADSEMSNSLAALKQAAPEVFAYLPESRTGSESHSEIFSQSEHKRTLEFNGYLLTVVYDLLATDSSGSNQAANNGQIYDWKTHQSPPQKEWLQQDWQTRLYPYVLCETSELTTEQVSMTYWFVRVGEEPAAPNGQKPSFHRFDYTLTQHDQTRRDLQRLTNDLSQMIEAGEFPKVAVEKGYCDQCAFNLRCDRLSDGPRHHPTSQTHPPAQNPTQLLKAARQLTADSVEEIPL